MPARKTIIAYCRVCGRPIYEAPGTSGPKPVYCRATTKEKGYSACRMIAKRADELARMSVALVERLERAGLPDDEVRTAAQSVKSHVWSELNSATNVLGKLARKKATV